MTGQHRPGFSGAMPAHSAFGCRTATDHASGLILRLQDSNRGLEILLRELKRDESRFGRMGRVSDAHPLG